MNTLFKVVVPAVGGLALLATGIAVYRAEPVAVTPSPYQAAALDLAAPAETASPPEQQGSSPAVPAPEIVEFTPPPAVPLPVPANEPPPAPPVIVAEAVPLPVAPPVQMPVIETSPVGVGGTLANIPPAPPVQEPAPPAAAPDVQPAVSLAPAVAPATPDTAAASTTQPAASNLSTVFISEIFVDMVGADTEEFVELFNNGTSSMSLASSSLQYISGTATSLTSLAKKNFPAGAVIPPAGYYLIGMGGYAGAVSADMAWSQSLGNIGATLLLVRDQEFVAEYEDPDILDRVAYGSSTLLLAAGGTPVLLPSAGQSLERSAASSSFNVLSTPRPQNAAAH